jgi:hypothetical protein
MSEKISGVCKVWRGEYGFLLADDGRAVFLHYRECERCGIRPPKPATNSSSKSSVAVKVCALSLSAMSD